MNFDPNNPNWTAYALGEIPENEQAPYIEEVEANPDAKKFIGDIQAFSGKLTEGFETEESPSLSESQKEAILTSASENPKNKIILFPSLLRVGIAAAAAAVVLVFLLPIGSTSRRAQNETTVIASAAREDLDDDTFFAKSSDEIGQDKKSTEKWERLNAGAVVENELTVDKDERKSLNGERAPRREKSALPPPGTKERSRDEYGDKNAQASADTSLAAPQSKSVAKPKNTKKTGRRVVQAPKSQVSAKGDLLLEGQSVSDYSQLTSRLGKSANEKLGLGYAQSSTRTWNATDSCGVATPAGLVLRVTEKEEAATPNHFGPSIERYSAISENAFKRVEDHPLSTFSIDVDTASYANVRRFLKGGSLPPKDAVRIEEMINYFDYQYEPPTGETPFATHLEMSTCPWQPEHKLVRIGLKGKVIENDQRPACNLVFLLDVSGSMNQPNKLPLVKKAMTALVNNLDARDRIAIVVYAGASGLVLPSTSCANPQAIVEAMDRLKAGGGTNGGAGIDLAYKTAIANLIEDGVNRVILCTDGDFNIGTTQTGDLVNMIEERAKKGVFLSVLGFGMGNYKDGQLEQLADKGNGNYGYIDTFSEARKLLVDQLSGTLVTIAKDVKIQVEFNPQQVAGYRLIGYENRMLNKEDFNDDKKDAGEIGAGHTVTALYEIIPTGTSVSTSPAVDPLKYQPVEPKKESVERSAEILTVKLRYKQPTSDTSTKVEFVLNNTEQNWTQASPDFQFANAVAGFGMLLRGSEHKGSTNFDLILELAQSGQGEDKFGYRRAFLDLVRNAKALMPSK